MALQTARRLVALAGCGSLALALQVPADGADATFTRITTPSGRTTLLVQGDRQLTVAGVTSLDVTQVTVYCLRGSGDGPGFDTVATAVPVTNGAFSVAGLVSPGSVGPICRLRAVPQGVDPSTDPLSAYSGPILDLDSLQRLTQDTHTYNFDLTAGTGEGEMRVRSAGYCGNQLLHSVQPDLGRPAIPGGCVASLGPSAADGTTGSLRVDGHLALLPYSVLTYADASTSLKVRVHVARSGIVTWTESAPLVRCANTDLYPPPVGQCDDVVPTGVSFTRSGTFASSGHQIRLRDSFGSTDGKRHTVNAIYAMEWPAPPTGALGFAFPGRPGGFHGSSSGQVVTGLPKRAATFLVRSDRFSVEGDPQADTRAVTWSRTPTRLAFAPGDATVFGMSYRLHVPRGGAARLGITDSEAVRTTEAARAGRRAAAAMMPSPRITVPDKGAVITGRKTVVKGTVKAGANGLPVSVTVNGHAATLTPEGASRATYKVVFKESLGKHTLTAVARDAGGNKRSTSITVRNK
jgi:hypothetical protein